MNGGLEIILEIFVVLREKESRSSGFVAILLNTVFLSLSSPCHILFLDCSLCFMSAIPVKPFKPLPPLTTMDDIRETSIVFEQNLPLMTEMDDASSQHWMLTNRSVALSSETWNHPLMMMEDDDDEDMHEYFHPDTDDRHPLDATNSVKRVSLDLTETFMVEEEESHTHTLHDHAVVGQDDFVFMVEGLEQDPILALPTTTDAMVLDADAAIPSCRHHTNFLEVEEEDDPWIEAAAEAVFEMNHDGSGIAIFEFDHSASSFAKLQHDHTVGTEESTMSSSNSSPQLQPLLNPSSFSEEFQERRQMLAESMRASQLSRQCLSLQEHVKLRANLAQVLKDIESSTATVQRHLRLTEATALNAPADGAPLDTETTASPLPLEFSQGNAPEEALLP